MNYISGHFTNTKNKCSIFSYNFPEKYYKESISILSLFFSSNHKFVLNNTDDCIFNDSADLYDLVFPLDFIDYNSFLYGHTIINIISKEMLNEYFVPAWEKTCPKLWTEIDFISKNYDILKNEAIVKSIIV